MQALFGILRDKARNLQQCYDNKHTWTKFENVTQTIMSL